MSSKRKKSYESSESSSSGSSSASPKKKVVKKKKRGKKKKKEKVLRKRSAYAFYMRSERPKFALNNPTAAFGELSKIMGKHWSNNMTEEEKKPFYDMAKEDEKRYYKEKSEEGSESSSSSSEKKKPRKKRKKDPNEPKKPSNAFIFWCKQNRSIVQTNNPDVTGQEITKLCGKLWKELTEVNKGPYKDLAAGDKLRYQKELEEYKKKDRCINDICTY